MTSLSRHTPAKSYYCPALLQAESAAAYWWARTVSTIITVPCPPTGLITISQERDVEGLLTALLASFDRRHEDILAISW